jgi:hypothetical protein
VIEGLNMGTAVLLVVLAVMVVLYTIRRRGRVSREDWD